MKYIYTATFSIGKDGTVYASVPDLKGCISTAKNLDDAINMITDAASVWLVTAEDEGLDIAPATPQEQLKSRQSDAMSLIRIDTIEYRARTDTKSVRKNVSLPAWMAYLADKRGINCSKVLQDGLLEAFER